MFKGTIYKITGSCGRVYIGSTKNPKIRFNCHSKKYTRAGQLLEHPLRFELIREDNYKFKSNLLLVEQFYINNNDTINKNKAFPSRIPWNDRKGKCECGDTFFLKHEKRHRQGGRHFKRAKRLEPISDNPPFF